MRQIRPQRTQKVSGWQGSTRKQTLPPGWWRIRGHVLNRDGHACQHVRYDTGNTCGAPANQVDHVGDRDDHSPANLRALCEWHHLQRSSSQGGTAAAAKRKKAQKQKHPGII